MGYKQHNNPFSRKISSPLKHSIVNSQGKPWSHSHKDGRVSGRVMGGKIIRGDKDFMKRRNRAVTDDDTKTKRMKDGKRATSKNYAKAYADQLARAYNMGAITGGQFLAEEYRPGKGKFELFKDGDLIDFSTRGGNIGEGGMYNVQWGEREGLVAPETQITADEIYDMMVQGGGLVSIVDGKIVAGNPNKVRFSEEGTTGSGHSTHKLLFQSDLADDYIPEGYMTEQAYQDERANQRGKMTVKELLELRKQKNNPINRVMSNSPLQSNHDEMTDDERSDYNISGDPRVSTVTEIVYDDNGRPIGEKDIITTEQDYIREREITGDPTPPPPPNWNDCYINGVFQTGMVVGEGPDAIKCEFRDPDDTPPDPVEPTIETDQYTDTNVEEVFRPYEPEITTTEEEEQPEDPLFEFDLGGGRKKKRGFDIELPDIPLPELGLDQLNILQKKCGGCRQRSLIQRAILALGGGI